MHSPLEFPRTVVGDSDSLAVNLVWSGLLPRIINVRSVSILKELNGQAENALDDIADFGLITYESATPNYGFLHVRCVEMFECNRSAAFRGMPEQRNGM